MINSPTFAQNRFLNAMIYHCIQMFTNKYEANSTKDSESPGISISPDTFLNSFLHINSF